MTDAPLDEWHGVTVVDGRVTDVVLYTNRLTGSYYLSAVPRPLDNREEKVDRSFPPVYYPRVLNPQEAAKVEVAAGEEVGGFTSP